MNRLVCILGVIPLVFFACSSDSKSRCNNAFDHMTDVSKREMAALPKAEREMAEKFAAKLEGKDAEQRAAFIQKCGEGKIDVDCIMKAPDTFGYVDCFSP